MRLESPLVITVAPTGAEVTREQNPSVPYSAREVADEAVAACETGATVVHLHARRPDGTPTGDPVVFAEIVERIRERVDAVLMFSTGGAAWMDDEERLAPLAAGPGHGVADSRHRELRRRRPAQPARGGDAVRLADPRGRRAA